MVSNYDELRYGRDWRHGSDWSSPGELEGGHYLWDVWLMVFMTPDHRRQYAEEQKSIGCHMDFLSEREMACVIDVPSRQKVWGYFGIGNGDYSTVTQLLEEGKVMIYGKSAPADFAADEKS